MPAHTTERGAWSASSRLRAAGTATAIAGAASVLAPPAHAQPATPPASAPDGGTSAPTERAVPPTLLAPPDVPYPADATGDAEVILTLVIDREGRVETAVVDAGEEPFAGAARAAAKGFRFAPATLRGEARASRIKMAIGFREPPPEPPEEPAPPPPTRGAPAQPTAPPPPAPIDVTISEDRPPPGTRTISRAEVRQLPGAFGDPLRAIEILPGVTPIVSGLPYFYVRGAPPSNVGYFLDGVRIPYLFHAAAGPSVVHPALIDRVDLYPGGYPAKFGRFAGAVVAAETTPPAPEAHGEGALRLVDVGALVEAPFANGRGTALAAGRYSYTGAILSLISPEITLDYRDFQARATYAPTAHEQLTLFTFGSYDLLTQTTNEIETVLFGSEFYRLDARYDVTLPGEGHLRWAATAGFDQTRVADQRNARDALWGTRVELALPVAETATFRAGMDVMFDDYEADGAAYGDPEDPDVAAYNRLFPSRTDATAAVWTDVVWQLDPRLQVVPGLRMDLFHSGTASGVGVDPRLALRVDVTKEVRINHALGVAHQPPSFVLPVPGLAVGNLDGGLQTTLQAASGVEVDLPEGITSSLTFFQSVFLNMSDTAGVQPPGNAQNQIPRSLGGSRGIEVMVRRDLSRDLGGLLSYTWSRSTRTIGGYTFPFAFDRTHVLQSALSYALGRGWRAGTRFSFYTGAPILEAPEGQAETVRLLSPQRDPAFYRLDFRLEKRWTLGETTWLAFVVEMLNATLNQETLRGNEVGPVSVPSIGLEGGF